MLCGSCLLVRVLHTPVCCSLMRWMHWRQGEGFEPWTGQGGRFSLSSLGKLGGTCLRWIKQSN